MSNYLVALMFAAGVGGWTYYQMMRRSGSNIQGSWIVTILVGAVAYFVCYTLFAWVFNF